MTTSMFERYGGFATVSKVVMAFYDKVLDSDVIGDYFEDIDMRRLIDHQTKFIATVMGGPASYTDDMLRRVHASLKIDRPAFDEMALLLRETLEEFELEPDDITTVLQAIEDRSGVVIASAKE